MSIRKLPEDVVNKIAAGEILVRPVNAIKELIENSIDAGAKNITVIVSGGGLSSIQIIDDGSGIAIADHALLCERFATSKLRSFEELNSGRIASFGFRGEALASVSLVGHVSVYSKHMLSSDSHGYESRYSSGKLLPGYPVPVPFNGVSGTRILVEDLFFNNPVKKSSFKSSSHEYRLILDLVSRFAIAFPSIDFSLKKSHETCFDIQVRTDQSRLSRIESLFGIDSNLLIDGDSVSVPIDTELPYPLLSFEFVTSKSDSTTKSSPIILINERIVEFSSFSKLFDSEYVSQFGGVAPFLFLKICIKPDSVDVNVSPTKKTVVFINEQEINSFIVNSIMTKIIASRKIKLIKLKPLSFSSSELKKPRLGDIGDSQLPLIPTSQPVTTASFKIHTCPRQNFFTVTAPDIVKVDEETLSNFIKPSSQVSLAFSQLESSQNDDQQLITKLSPSLPDVSQSSQPCRIKRFIPPEATTLVDQYTIQFSNLSGNRGTPKDALILIGQITEKFVICQYFSHLCICNVKFLGEFLIKWWLVSKWVTCGDNVGEEHRVQGVPLWIHDLLGIRRVGDDTTIDRMPSLIGQSLVQSLTRPEANDIVQRLIAFCTNDSFVLSSLSPDSLDWVLTFIAHEIVEMEFASSNEKIWNAIVKNGKFYPSVPVSDKPTSPPEPLTTNNATATKSQFFFKEIISLKELYKEFERC